VISFLESCIVQHADDPEVSGQYTKLHELYQKKLWHNLTDTLMELVKMPQVQKELFPLYYNFIHSFENKINQLSFAQLVITISKPYSGTTVAMNEAIKFLEMIGDKLGAKEGNAQEYLLVRAVLIQLKLRNLVDLDELKLLIEAIENSLEGLTGIDPIVHSNFYRAKAEYHKLKGHAAEFYKFALLFLSYTNLETIPEEEKRQFAFDLGIAALVSEDIFNFGDLLAHPIVKSLESSKHEWLALLLRAFNSGDIDKYEELVAKHKDELCQEPILVQSTQLLKDKIAILCLMELVFNRHSVNRTIPFGLIAEATRCPIQAVELLVMHALSLKLIKGHIDEVNEEVIVTWVQPRVLEAEQIARMKERLDDWAKRVHDTLISMEQGTPELFS